MNIQCESCQARYRLDERLFKDSRAVRVKCRKCGGYIVVARPEAPEAPPVAPSFVVAREAVVAPPAEPVSAAPPAAELSAPPVALSFVVDQEAEMAPPVEPPAPPMASLSWRPRRRR